MKEVHVALLGLGNVGRAFTGYCALNGIKPSARISIRAVADSSGGLVLEPDADLYAVLAHKSRGGKLSEFAKPASLIADIRRFIGSLRVAGISVLIESLPTNIDSGQPALDFIALALSEGLSVVTVDKGPLVHGFDALNRAAAKAGSLFAYSGTTGVTIPHAITGKRVLEIVGVLNGTTNYILTEMTTIGFDRALAQAQAEGIAEPDPSLDIEGWDTSAKILILARALMSADLPIAAVARTGIDSNTEALVKIAQTTGKAVRLLGRARIRDGRVSVTVAPEVVEPDSPFFSVRGTSKLVVFKTEQGDVVSTSRSGRDAISQTILDDLWKVAGVTG